MCATAIPNPHAVCFGTIDRDEWHIDFSLIPKNKRRAAARAFRGQIMSLQPGHGSLLFVYHRDAQETEVRKQPRNRDRYTIGEKVR